ncbi:MAG: T9SS type A sorting domain-containing protein [Bacteroidales bacterium]|nr:T9SS type A sorting domain-containing protein [Bacteroidales bacterium]
MTKSVTYHWFQTRCLRYCFFVCIVALFTQFSFSQDYKFEQTDDPHRLVVIEAENFSSNTPNGDVAWMLTDSPVDFSGQGAMMAVTASPFTTVETVLAGSAVLTYKIKFIKAGVHYIWARASRTGGGDDSYHAGINGVITDESLFLTFHETDFDYGTWGWINYHGTVGPASVVIPSAGVHELNLYIRENGFRIDKILLTEDDTSSYKPEGMGPDETLAQSAIRDISRNNNVFSAWPNPANRQLKIQLNDNKYANGMVKIVDLQGRLMQVIRLDGNRSTVVDVSRLDAGVYMLQYECNNRVIAVDRFLKY